MGLHRWSVIKLAETALVIIILQEGHATVVEMDTTTIQLANVCYSVFIPIIYYTSKNLIAINDKELCFVLFNHLLINNSSLTHLTY